MSPVFLIVVAVLSIVFYVLYMRAANNDIEAEEAAFEEEQPDEDPLFDY